MNYSDIGYDSYVENILFPEKTTPERRTCNKEKENESANKNKRLSKRHSARVSDQVLKNVKLNNFNKSSALLSDSDESNREEDVYLLSTPKLKSRKLSRNSTSKSVDYSNKLSESGLGTPSTKSVSVNCMSLFREPF